MRFKTLFGLALLVSTLGSAPSIDAKSASKLETRLVKVEPTLTPDNVYSAKIAIGFKNASDFKIDISSTYSLCFGPTEQFPEVDKNIRPICVNGGYVDVGEIQPGKEVVKTVNVRYAGKTVVGQYGSDETIVGKTPHTSLSVERLDYETNHLLPKIERPKK
jgi:hypothetical protein